MRGVVLGILHGPTTPEKTHRFIFRYKFRSPSERSYLLLQPTQFIFQHGVSLHDFVKSIGMEFHFRNLRLGRENLSLKQFYMFFRALANGPLSLSIIGTLSLELFRG
jgi:hypothetical protein